MSAPARASSDESETAVLEDLRSRYEAEGFTFTLVPDRSGLPGFLGSYVPDAIARKPDRNIAIEVKRHPSRTTQKRLQDIRALFDGHPDWQFSVVYVGSRPLEALTIPAAAPGDIRRRIAEVRALSEQGHLRPAFVMAWSLLEAALQSIDEAGDGKPHTPGTVLQTLAMNGHIAPESERRVRGLIQLRNRIVHGDVAAEPTSDEVQSLLAVVEEALAAHTGEPAIPVG